MIIHWWYCRDHNLKVHHVAERKSLVVDPTMETGKEMPYDTDTDIAVSPIIEFDTQLEMIDTIYSCSSYIGLRVCVIIRSVYHM